MLMTHQPEHPPAHPPAYPPAHPPAHPPTHPPAQQPAHRPTQQPAQNPALEKYGIQLSIFRCIYAMYIEIICMPIHFEPRHHHMRCTAVTTRGQHMSLP